MTEETIKTLTDLNARFIDNFIARNSVAHDAIIHQRFLCIMPDGAKLTRAPYLEYWATAFDPETLIYFDYRDESISLFGNTALVRSATKYVRLAEGEKKEGMNIYTDTYLLEGGTWLCVQAHLTPVAAQHYPGDETIIRAWTNGTLSKG